MTEEDVQREIKTPAVLEAFERAKLINLPQRVKVNYEEEDLMFENLSGYMAEREAKGKAEGEAIGVEKGKAEGVLEIAKRMIKKGRTLEEICEVTELPVEVVRELLNEVFTKNVEN